MPTSQTFPLPDGYQPRAHVMPWWLGYLSLSPLRRLLDRPQQLLSPHIKAGDTVLEAGPAMGFHTLPLAEMVGADGRVVAVDCQEKMLEHLRRRAARRRLDERIETRHCSPQSLGVGDLAGRVDAALAMHVVHESPDPERMIGELARALRPGGRLVLAEPRDHVKREVFLWEYGLCREAGLVAVDWPRRPRQMVVVMEKPAEQKPAGPGTDAPDDLTPAA